MKKRNVGLYTVKKKMGLYSYNSERKVQHYTTYLKLELRKLTLVSKINQSITFCRQVPTRNYLINILPKI